jgi:hypothetical protein
MMPMLSIKEAAGLRSVCKALKANVEEWPMRLAEKLPPVFPPEILQAALTCFPATETMNVRIEEPLAPAEESRMVELLRGHGETLKRFGAEDEGARHLLWSAVRAGALPSLTYVHLHLWDTIEREILSGGMLRLLQEVFVLSKMTRSRWRRWSTCDASRTCAVSGYG